MYQLTEAVGGGEGVGDQREGLGLLKYQAMPSLHDVAHDGWCRILEPKLVTPGSFETNRV